MGKGFVIGAILCVALFQRTVWAFNPASIDWTGISDEIIFKDRDIKGRWSQTQRWKGLLCKGSLGAAAAARGYLEKLDLSTREDGKLDAVGVVSPIHINLSAITRSELSACTMVKVSQGISVGRMDILGIVEFIDKGDDVPPALKVKVVSTKIDRIRFNSWVPGWLEKKLTRVANRGLKRLWASQLGDKLSAALAKEFSKTIPFPE